MSITCRRLVVLWAILVILVPCCVHAAGPAPILLWPDGAPGAQGTEEADKPSIRIYAPSAKKSNGAAVVICPGGGYEILAYDHEGAQVAQRLNESGITGIVLQYRHAHKYHHPVPLQDAQRAIRYVRSHAEPLNVSPHRIGIMGFSAGGHLASTVSTHFDDGKPDASDPIERVSCRPDFSILCYPVITLQGEYAHSRSAWNLLGEEVSNAKLLESLSNQTQVTDQTPPAFLFHTHEDKGVRVENALGYYAACVKHNVPAEFHVFQNGPHGVGLAEGDPGVGEWSTALISWLRANGFLFDGKRSAVSGSITLHGQPLRWGSITLVPENPNAPTAWSMVNGGKFSIPAFRGAAVGPCRVTIRNMGGLDPHPSIEKSEIVSQPDTFVIVKDATAQNDFQFQLEPKTP